MWKVVCVSGSDKGISGKGRLQAAGFYFYFIIFPSRNCFLRRKGEVCAWGVVSPYWAG